VKITDSLVMSAGPSRMIARINNRQITKRIGLHESDDRVSRRRSFFIKKWFIPYARPYFTSKDHKNSTTRNIFLRERNSRFWTLLYKLTTKRFIVQFSHRSRDFSKRRYRHARDDLRSVNHEIRQRGRTRPALRTWAELAGILGDPREIARSKKRRRGLARVGEGSHDY